MFCHSMTKGVNQSDVFLVLNLAFFGLMVLVWSPHCMAFDLVHLNFSMLVFLLAVLCIKVPDILSLD